MADGNIPCAVSESTGLRSTDACDALRASLPFDIPYRNGGDMLVKFFCGTCIGIN
jgi:hypothetical protein